MGQFDVGVPFQIAHKQSDFGLHIAFPKREKKEDATARHKAWASKMDINHKASLIRGHTLKYR